MKLVFIMISAVFFAGIDAAMSATLSQGMVGYYSFTGDATDMSANQIDGLVQGPVLWPDQHNNTDASFKFNGISDYIELPASNALQFADQNFALGFWFKADSLKNANGTSWFLDRSSTDGSIGFKVGTSYNQIIFSDLSSRTETWGSALKNNTWIHIAIVREGTARNQLKIYINGQLDVAGTSNGYLGDLSPVLMGKTNTSNNEYYDGALDEIAFYDCALTTQSVNLMMSDPQAVSCGNISGDTDNDGVEDPVDLCPNTAADSLVDENGCPFSQKELMADDDLDGVINVLDQCPNTAVESYVSNVGCPLNVAAVTDAAYSEGFQAGEQTGFEQGTAQSQLIIDELNSEIQALEVQVSQMHTEEAVNAATTASYAQGFDEGYAAKASESQAEIDALNEQLTVLYTQGELDSAYSNGYDQAVSDCQATPENCNIEVTNTATPNLDGEVEKAVINTTTGRFVIKGRIKDLRTYRRGALMELGVELQLLNQETPLVFQNSKSLKQVSKKRKNAYKYVR